MCCTCAAGSAAETLDPAALAAALHAVESGVASGFQLASAAGPLCDEPMWGVAFEVRCLPADAAVNTRPYPSIVSLFICSGHAAAGQLTGGEAPACYAPAAR